MIIAGRMPGKAFLLANDGVPQIPRSLPGALDETSIQTGK